VKQMKDFGRRSGLFKNIDSLGKLSHNVNPSFSKAADPRSYLARPLSEGVDNFPTFLLTPFLVYQRLITGGVAPYHWG
jgi:hypothetical protein